MGKRSHLPVKSNGFIDEDKIFTLAIVKLKIPFSEFDQFIEEYTFHHLGLLIDAQREEQQEFLKMLADTVTVGYAQARTGKKIKMFEKEGEGEKVKKVSAEKREETMDFLTSNFKKKL